MNITIEPSRRFSGSPMIPGDKSSSHRALMLSAIAGGQSTISNLSQGEDVRDTALIMTALGATVTRRGEITVVDGPIDGLHASDSNLWCGNSGTTMRLLAGILSGVPGIHVLSGDDSLSRRPMDRVAAPLTLMGASVSGDGKRVLPPLTIAGRKNLVGITYRTPVPSAQVKSAIMFAGLSAMSPTSIAEETRTRDTTERMMRLAGLDVETHQSDDGQVVTVHPGRPKPTDWLVPGDPSQAAYWIVGSLLATNGDVSMSNIDVSPERIGFLSVLERMGANISFSQNGQIRALSSILKGTVIHSREIPSVDEVPILVVAAAAASGMTHFIDMDELRHKESDRFEQSVRLARSVGCAVTVDGDDFIIEGVGNAENFQSFEFSSTLDHRMIMAAAIAGAVGRGVTLEGIEAVSSSYPNFFDVLQTVRS